MPNCTTVVQTENDLFGPEVRLNSPKKGYFTALYPTKKPSKIFRDRLVNHRWEMKTSTSYPNKINCNRLQKSPLFMKSTYLQVSTSYPSSTVVTCYNPTQ